MLTDVRQATVPAALQEVALPRRLERLSELVCNLWWTWHPAAQGICKLIDPSLWNETYHNPVKFLRQVKRKSLNAAVVSTLDFLGKDEARKTLASLR